VTAAVIDGIEKLGHKVSLMILPSLIVIVLMFLSGH
jgi:hypothetical protein